MTFLRFLMVGHAYMRYFMLYFLPILQIFLDGKVGKGIILFTFIATIRISTSVVQEQKVQGKNSKIKTFLIISDFSGIPFLTACCISLDELNCNLTVLSCLPSLDSLSMVVLKDEQLYILFHVHCVAILGHIILSQQN